MTAKVGFHTAEDSRTFPTSSIGYFRLAPECGKSDLSDVDTQFKSRVEARLAALKINAFEAARRMGKGTGRDFVNDILNGKKKAVRGDNLDKLARALECDTSYLVGATEAAVEQGALVRVIGRVGANTEGRVFLSTGDQGWDMTPIPIGGSLDSVALQVDGHSMRGLADNGALIYFEDQRSPPTPDMLGHVVVLETADGQVLVKRLLKGTHKGVYDLESLVGERLEDQRLKWAAHIISIVPPYMAARVIRRADIEQSSPLLAG